MHKGLSRGGGVGKTSRTLLAAWALLTLMAAGVITGIFSGGGSSVFAATPVISGGKAVVTNTDGDPIRIREGAGTQYAAIAWAREGHEVRVLEGPVTDSQGIVWFKIEASAVTGWMMAEFLDGKAEPAAPSEPRLTGSARVANTNGDPLRVRTQPNTDGRVVAKLDPGTVVSIDAGPVTDAVGIVWYQIRVRSISGWSMAQYLVQAQGSGAGAGQAATATPRPTDTPVPQPTPDSNARTGNTNSGSGLSQYRQWMEEARAMYPYPQSVEKMWSVMMCESSGNPNASGGGGAWLGLFQYAPGTWRGSWNPYRNESIWDAKAQIFGTAKAWSIGMQRHWSCY